MRLCELQENEVVGLFKEHPLSDLPHTILEMLLDYYNLNSYGMATQKMKELTNSITAQLKQNGYTISHNGDILQVTKGRDRYVAHEEEIMEMLLNALYLQEEVTSLFKNYSLTDLPEDIRKMAYLWFAITHKSTTEGDKEKLNFMTAKLKQNGYTARVNYETDEVIVTKGRERYTDSVDEVMIRLISLAMKQDNSDIDEGMGGSSGGGTAGSAGAGGSSLGLPYPSTYEEENDKFKYRSPVQRQMSLTTEEQGEMFTDHQKMKQMMNEKGWPQDLQTEVLRKYASHVHEGQMFIRNVSYVTTKNLSNYGLLQNTDNMFILSQLPQSAINRINKEWNLKIQPSKFIKMPDLEYQKWINTSGYVSQPTVVIDADVIMAEGKWIASVIRGHRSKLCHVLTPGGPKVKSNDPNLVLSPGNQKELAFVESVLSEEDKLWARDELPQLNIENFEDSNYILKQFNVDISKLKPVQNERIKGLVNKTIKMLKKGKHKPMVIDKMGYIVNGHHRYDAYNKLIKNGFFKTSDVPVIKVNATIEELIDKYM